MCGRFETGLTEFDLADYREAIERIAPKVTQPLSLRKLSLLRNSPSSPGKDYPRLTGAFH